MVVPDTMSIRARAQRQGTHAKEPNASRGPVARPRPRDMLTAAVTRTLALAASAVDFVPGAHMLAGISTQKRLVAFLAVNVAFMVVEFVHGYLNHSLGMLSDAAHMLLDNAAVVIGLAAEHYAAKCASGKSSGDPNRWPHGPHPIPLSTARIFG